jgi:sphingomyelin phosphodiesterase acid-like 3
MLCNSSRAGRFLRVAIAVAFPLLAAAPGAAGTMVAISDIHFDPFANPSIAQALRARAPKQWQEVLALDAGRGLPTYGSDSNGALLLSALDALERLASSADIVVMPGDLLSHHFNRKAANVLGAQADGEEVRAFAATTTRFVIEAVRQAAAGRPVVYALGNEDAACGDYAIVPNGAYLTEVGQAVKAAAGSDFLYPSFDRTFTAGGWYAMRHPGLRRGTIVVLNMVLWSSRYRDRCGTGGEDAAFEQLAFLRAALGEARERGEKVWLVAHIPPGIDSHGSAASADPCQRQPVMYLREAYQAAVLELVREHAQTITAILTGHVHKDGYRALAGGDAGAAFAKIIPSISPIFGNDPAMQEMEYDDAGRLTGLTTWRLDLSAKRDAWSEEYVFSEAYGVPLGPEAVQAIAEAAQAGRNAAVVQRFAEYYPTGHDAPTGRALKAIACAIDRLTPSDFMTCLCGSEDAAD